MAMSRWLVDRANGSINVVSRSGFGHFNTGTTGVIAPRGLWSYGPRMGRAEDRIKRRPLVVFRDNVLIGCTETRQGLFRRDFTPGDCQEFDDEWYSYRAVSRVTARRWPMRREPSDSNGARDGRWKKPSRSP